MAIISAPLLQKAVFQANQIIFERDYIVAVANKEISLTKPVFLELRYPNGAVRNIGIIHLVQLTGN
jgi:hypothetical protein